MLFVGMSRNGGRGGGPLKMLGRVGVWSTEPYTIYGSKIGYRLLLQYPFLCAQTEGRDPPVHSIVRIGVVGTR